MHTPDPITVIIEWLSEHPTTPTATVSGDAPSDRLDQFVTVERTGGTPEELRDDATVTIHCHATSSLEAMSLARSVADRLRDMSYRHPAVAGISVLSLYNNPETVGDRKPRATINLQITIAPTIK